MTPEQAAAIQLLDEQLTAAGHDSECAAYEPGKECSCGVGDRVGTIVKARSRGDARPEPDSGTVLTGDADVTYRRMLEAGKRAREAQQAVAAANQEFQAALAAHLEVAAR
jgi:hypothetical protein